MTANLKRAFPWWLALLMGLGGLWGCNGSGSSTPQGPRELVVGSLLALSGPDKSFGVTQQRGMQIALDEVNEGGAIGGRPLRVEFADTKLTEDLALQEFKRLRANGIEVFAGITGSGVNLRLSPFATQQRVVLIDSLATSPRLTAEGGEYFFRTIASDADSGVVLSKWAVERGHRKLALVYNSENAWSNGLKSGLDAGLPEAGGTWASEAISVLNSTDNFGAAIVALRGGPTKPDAVFVCLMGRQAGLFVNQAVANGLDVPFYGTDTFSQQEFVENARGAAQQSFFVLPAEEKGPRYQAFESKYRERFGAEADSIAAKSYDMVQVLAVALREASKTAEGPTGQNVRDALAQASYDGITGPIAFDKQGDLTAPRFDRFTYKDGRRTTAP